MPDTCHEIEFQGVSKAFGDRVPVLADLSLELGRGDWVSLVGPSGCGKTTLLNLAAGLMETDSGSVRVKALPPEQARGRIGYIFQDPTLLPWLTVEQNVLLPLKMRGVERAARYATCEEMLRLVRMHGATGKYPRQLSGGMKMRASLARALALKPEILLMDEPFGALDAIRRNHLNEEILRIRESRPWTTLFVTHSVNEAVFLSNRVVVMGANPGRITEVFEVPFGYPRAPEIREDQAYLMLVGKIHHALREAENTA